ncbi:MAG: 4-hydroxy-2-oxoheptanedioate aldolase [Gammaproteobacteria bacterium]|nr:4-hydroxy-2-oxoheptanedioate aldolase [Gammaproteobacteria bacterium]
MDVPHNEFKRAIAAGAVQYGLWAGLADPCAAEICAGAGFDWLLIDAEHAPNDVRTVLAQLQAVAPYPVHPIVRPVRADAALVKQLLDVGAQTLLVPMVEDAEQAAALVAAMRYPPRGIRGVGTALARAARWNAVADYVHHADEQMCLLVQVESVRGLENLDAIAGVTGVDGVFIGPADLAASLGHLGASGHAEVRAAIEDAFRRIAAAGKAPGILATDPALACHYVAHGARFVAVGVDTLLLRTAATALAAAFKHGTRTGELD